MAGACISRENTGNVWHIRRSGGICKPAKGTVVKRHGGKHVERRWRIRGYQESVKKLNESEPLLICRMGSRVGDTT